MNSKKVLNSFSIFFSLTDLKINKPNLNLMKKSNLLFERLPFSKGGILPFLLTFLFFAVMQLDMNGQTTFPSGNPIQAPGKVMYHAPSGNFVSVPVAMDRLLTAMTALKGQLEQYAEGTAPYDAAFLRYTYYSYVRMNLEAGRTVSEAIIHGLGNLNSDLSLGVTPEQALAEKNAAIALLRP